MGREVRAGRKRSRSPWSVASYLTGFFVAFCIAIVATTAMSARQNTERARDALAGAAADVAEQAAVRIDDAMTSSLNVLDSLSGFPDLVTGDPAKCAQALRGFRHLNTHHLAVVRTNGAIVCTSRGTDGVDDVDYRDFDWFTGTEIAPSIDDVSDPYVDPLTGRLSLAEIENIGTTSDGLLLVGVVDLFQFAKHLADVNGRSSVVTLIDPDAGVVLARSKDMGRWAGTTLDDHPELNAALGDDVEPHRGLSGGGPYVFGTAPTSLNGWQVVAGLDEREGLAPSSDLNRRQWMIAGLILAVTAVLCLIEARVLVRPLRRLTADVANSDGTTGSIPPPGGPSELARLADAFSDAITSSTRAQRAMARNEARFRSLVQHSSDLTLVTRDDRSAVYASPSAGDILGYSPEELAGMDIRELIHRDDAKALRAAVVATAPAQPVRHVLRVLHPTKGWRHLSIVRTDLTNDPAVGGIVINARDDTERHDRQQLIEDHARLLEDIAAGVPLTVVAGSIAELTERHGTASCAIVHCYTESIDVVAAPSADVAQIEAMCTTDVLERVHAAREIAAGSASTAAAAETVTEDGQVCAWLPVGDVPDGVIAFIVCGVEDMTTTQTEAVNLSCRLLAVLTSRDRVQGVLRDSESRFRTAFSSSPVGLGLIDPRGRFSTVNRAVLDILGYESDLSLVDQPWSMITGRCPEGIDPDEVLRRAETDVVNLDAWTLTRVDGTEVVCDGRVAAVSDRAGEISYFILQIQDVTSQHRAAEEISELNDILLAQLVEIDSTRANLQEALAQLSSAREAEKRSLAMALHDDAIQALIATQWSMESLIDEAGIGDADRDAAAVRSSLDAAIAALRKQTFELLPPGLDQDGLEVALRHLTHTATDAGLRMTLSCNIPRRPRKDVEVLVFRTIQEAVRNTIRHAQAQHLEVVVHDADGVIVGEVNDDGIGVDADVLELRARESHIGVLSMRETIQIAGGTFRIESREASGTTVHFEIPVEGAPTRAALQLTVAEPHDH